MSLVQSRTPQGAWLIMDVLWKQLADLNAAVDAARERWINLQYLRYEFMQMVQHGSVNKRFQGELIKLKDLQSNLEKMRDTTRQSINEAVRPFLRPLKILDLPDELLCQISLWVKGGPFTSLLPFDDAIVAEVEGVNKWVEPDVAQVKKLRLTCRRFCATSSHLLMSYVRVDMTPQRLARLDEVSRHQTISTGIRRVEISLGYHYDADIAHDIRAFARFQGNKLRQEISFWQRSVQNPFDSSDPEILQKAIDRGITIAESFEEAAQNGLDENCLGHNVLREAQEFYRQQYESQILLQHGPFAQAIVSAMLRMPTATRLSILDDDYGDVCGSRSLSESIKPEDLENLDALRQRLQAPSFMWDYARLLGLKSPPFDVIPSVLLSIGEAGICLNGLAIDVSWPDELSSFAARQAELLKLQASSPQLKEFKFCPHRFNTLPIKAVRLLADTLPTFFHMPSLRTIDLCFDFMYGRKTVPRPTVSMAPILLSRTWPSLEKMSFNGPFYLEDLRKVVNHIGKGVELRWCGYLMDGSWAEVLDFLQGCEQRTMITLGGASGSIAGAECESMSTKELDSIFSKDLLKRRLWSESRALSYIRGWTTQNPVTDWENGDLPTTEDEGVGDEEMDDEEI